MAGATAGSIRPISDELIPIETIMEFA